MKKFLLFFFAVFLLFSGANNLYSSAPEEVLKTITDSIPSNWWDGGWNKLGELEDFIYDYPGETALCATAQYYIGCYYHSKQKYPKAIEEYNKVLELYPSMAPQCAEAQFQVGQITLFSLDKPEEAITYYRKAIEICADNRFAPECLLMIGRAYMKLGNVAQAKIELQKVIDAYPAAQWQGDEARADLVKLDEGNDKKGSEKTKGVLTFPEGRYEGEIDHGRMNGRGVLVYASGNRYEGEFLENNFNGKGVYTWADGDRYEGDYVLSNKEGSGILTYNNGDVYEGQFKYDLYNGKGTFYSMSLSGGKLAKSGLWYLGQYLGKEEDGSATLIPTKKEDLNEEKRVAEILNGGNLERIDNVNEILKFADRLLEEGLESKAMVLYEAALVTDSLRFDYQLKLARIELKKGRVEEAVTRARAIYDYAEGDEIINEAKGILNEAGSADTGDAAGAVQLEPNMEMALVPVGDPDRRIMQEAAEIMQKELGFVMRVEQEAMELPADKSRDTSEIALNKGITEMLNKMPDESKKELFAAWNGSKDELKNVEGQKRFLRFALKQSGIDDAGVDNLMKIFEPHLQYNADVIIECLRKKYDVRAYNKIKAFIGITSADIYTGDFNTISCVSEKKYAIISYINYSGSANYDPQNRKLLVKRLSKAGIDAALNVIHIPNCSTPYCVNSNCGTIERRDTLDLSLCAKCKNNLADYKKRMK